MTAADVGSDPSQPSVVLRAVDLTVKAGSRTLLRSVHFEIHSREVVLLCAPSGTGKTVLLKVLAGLIKPNTKGFSISGRLEIDGVDRLSRPREVRGSVGIVFQDYALLEGTTIANNLAFAQAHRRPPLRGDEAKNSAAALAQELGLDAGQAVDGLSGGQKQRVAIARTLAFAPRVIAYDEPTSGLDPANKQRVAERIRTTNAEHDATSILVTHDVESLVDYVDRVLLIDPNTQTLREVERTEAVAQLLAVAPAAPEPRSAGFGSGWLQRFFTGTTGAVEGALLAVWYLIPRWPNLRFGWRFAAGYLRLVAGPLALLYFGLSGLVVGFVATYFALRFLPYREFTEGVILDDIVGALGFGLYRILIPLIITILIAARGGAAICADVGGRVVGNQLDAMRSLDAPPRRYLLTGVLWAFVLGTPLIALVAFWGARIGSAVGFAFMQPDLSLHYWSQLFHGQLYQGTEWVAARYWSAALLVGTVAYFRGEAPKNTAEDVARSITTTIIVTSLLVLTVQVVLSFFEFAEF